MASAVAKHSPVLALIHVLFLDKKKTLLCLDLAKRSV